MNPNVLASAFGVRQSPMGFREQRPLVASFREFAKVEAGRGTARNTNARPNSRHRPFNFKCPPQSTLDWT